MKKKYIVIFIVTIMLLSYVRFATIKLPKSGVWECDKLNMTLDFDEYTAEIGNTEYYLGGEYNSTIIYVSTINETVFGGASIFMIGRIMCIKEYDTGEKYWFYRQDSSNR